MPNTESKHTIFFRRTILKNIETKILPKIRQTSEKIEAEIAPVMVYFSENK